MTKLTFRELDLLRTALHMAAHEYHATYKDIGGVGPEAERCAMQRNRISALLPKIERMLQVAQGKEIVLRHGAAISWVDGVPQK